MESDLRDVFESGMIYADRWSSQVRTALDIPDKLNDEVLGAIQDRKTIIISGNAGDGKSHIAERVLDHLADLEILEVDANGEYRDVDALFDLLVIRDAAGLTDSAILKAVAWADERRIPLMVTVNEGPLNSLAGADPSGLFGLVRKTLHDRAQGLSAEDPPDTFVLNLAGRQLTRSGFVGGVLGKLLPLVSPCRVCSPSATCPRVVGSRYLSNSPVSQKRLELLLQILTDRGFHFTAREIWVFASQLFFGWTCRQGGDELDVARGYFWDRVFTGQNRISQAIAREFDPQHMSLPECDSLLWQGRFDSLDLSQPFPGTAPARTARRSADDALDLFANAKRFLFFFGADLDVERLIAQQSRAPEFGQLLKNAKSHPEKIVQNLVGLINKYRLAESTQSELWISRHHSFAAHRRPHVLAALTKIAVESLSVRLPFVYDSERFADAGFFANELLLHWGGSQQMLRIDFDTWRLLRGKRTLASDRDQETVDFALDLFMSQARPPSRVDPEITFYDHKHGVSAVLRLHTEDRSIEVL